MRRNKWENKRSDTRGAILSATVSAVGNFGKLCFCLVLLETQTGKFVFFWHSKRKECRRNGDYAG